MIMAGRDLLKRQPEPVRGRDPRGHRGQPLPLHRLPEHRQGRAGRRPARRRRAERDDRRRGARRPPEIGQSRRRKEDPHLITGRTTWTDNMTLPGMLHLAILRSPMAHATITSHRRRPRPRAGPASSPSFTGQDFAETQGNLPVRLAGHAGHGQPRRTRRWPSTQVNHVGEAVAVVAARTKAAAQDALEAHRRRLRAAAGGPRHGGRRSRTAPTSSTRTPSPTSPTPGSSSPARPAPARRSTTRCADAEVTVKRRFIQQRLIPAFMEPRSTVVQPIGDGVTMWSATQIPHILRTMLGADPRHPRAQGAGHRARRRRRLRRQAPGDAGGGHHARSSPAS